MSEALNKNISTISEEEVIHFLAENPDFFQTNPDSLLQLKLENTQEGSISLVERQLKGLRTQNKELKQELQTVINNAYENQQLLQQTIQLSLKLIPCSELSELKNELFQQLTELFDIEFQNLLLNKAFFQPDNFQSVALEEIQSELGDNFPKNQPVCGRLKESERSFLFGDESHVQSVAILPLGPAGSYGLLVLGSDDETHFDPEMGDLFLVLISDMLTQQLERFSLQE